MNTSNEREVSKMKREVKGINETIKVEDIVEKINLHVAVLKTSEPNECGTKCSKKIVSSLFNTLVLMLDITYDEAVTLIGSEDLFLFI